ncbi:hypothetical protein [Paenibacillus roseipurpureus]|uniref:DUF5615 domain-containing protein n=1 Tax=Paenibacillus roseopurpureus TaxID=2918901 RepID=A0AA96LQ03_9BACL|nr:hypothetical protein [Paenibacillus sp. MBLB1832]WNR42775.1 hypothetical protein MJB10_16805 [Paenibacillus sp. MBLB1832]
MNDHNDTCIIYSEIEIVMWLEQYLGIKGRKFTVDQDYQRDNDDQLAHSRMNEQKLCLTCDKRYLLQ